MPRLSPRADERVRLAQKVVRRLAIILRVARAWRAARSGDGCAVDVTPFGAQRILDALPVGPDTLSLKLVRHAHHRPCEQVIEARDELGLAAILQRHECAAELARHSRRRRPSAWRLVGGCDGEQPLPRPHAAGRLPLARALDLFESEEGVWREGAALVRAERDGGVCTVHVVGLRLEADDVRGAELIYCPVDRHVSVFETFGRKARRLAAARDDGGAREAAKAGAVGRLELLPLGIRLGQAFLPAAVAVEPIHGLGSPARKQQVAHPVRARCVRAVALAQRTAQCIAHGAEERASHRVVLGPAGIDEGADGIRVIAPVVVDGVVALHTLFRCVSTTFKVEKLDDKRNPLVLPAPVRGRLPDELT